MAETAMLYNFYPKGNQTVVFVEHQGNVLIVVHKQVIS